VPTEGGSSASAEAYCQLGFGKLNRRTRKHEQAPEHLTVPPRRTAKMDMQTIDFRWNESWRREEVAGP